MRALLLAVAALALLAAPAGAQTIVQPPFSGGTLTGPITAPGITSTGAIAGNVTATGSTAARALAERAADVVNVKDFGAYGDDTHDDSAAINAAIAYIRSLSWPPGGIQGSHQNARIVFPSGIYKLVASGVNATGLRTLHVVFDMQGASLDCHVAGGICFDLTYSQFLRVNGLSIIGDATDTPKIGIQVGRLNTESSDTLYFDRPTATGSFTFADYYNMASELNTLTHPSFYNAEQNGACYGMVLDGYNYWNESSAFQTVTAPVNTKQSLTAVRVEGGSIMGNSLSNGCTPVWMTNAAFSEFDHTYIERSSPGYGMVFYGSSSLPLTDITCTCHFEMSPALTDIFYIDGPVGAVDMVIKGFRYRDEHPQASNSIFKLSANVGFAVMQNASIDIDTFGGANVFDNAALWTVDGLFVENNENHWNAPASFAGTTDIQGVVSTTMTDLSLLKNTGTGHALVQSPSGVTMWIGPKSPAGGATVNITGDEIINGGLTLGNGGKNAFVTMPKAVTAPSAPGAGNVSLQILAGTIAGTCKLVAYAGTSTTPVTVLDNIGSGC